MQSNRIVFIPIIAVIAGLSAFLSVLLICLDLVPAFAAGEAMKGTAKHAYGKVETREYGEKAGVENRTLIGSGSVHLSGPEGREERSDRDERSAETAEQRKELERDHRPNPRELMHHLAEASEHLAIAGFHEEAEEFRDRASQMGADAGPADRRITILESRLRKLEGNISRMREEMGRLHRELREARKTN